MKQITNELFNKLKYLGILDADNIRDHNIGLSNYSKHIIQPWSIWLDYDLNAWDADIIKRTLRTKEGTPRKEDYMKIIHICAERIRQIEAEASIISDSVELEDKK